MKFTNRHLYLAIDNNNLDKVKLLVEQGADVKMKNWNGWTPMHSAAKVGSMEMVEFLISKGFLVNEKTTSDIGNFKKGTKPTEIARIMGCYKVAKYLENLSWTTGR